MSLSLKIKNKFHKSVNNLTIQDILYW